MTRNGAVRTREFQPQSTSIGQGFAPVAFSSPDAVLPLTRPTYVCVCTRSCKMQAINETREVDTARIDIARLRPRARQEEGNARERERERERNTDAWTIPFDRIVFILVD